MIWHQSWLTFLWHKVIFFFSTFLKKKPIFKLGSIRPAKTDQSPHGLAPDARCSNMLLTPALFPCSCRPKLVFNKKMKDERQEMQDGELRIWHHDSCFLVIFRHYSSKRVKTHKGTLNFSSVGVISLYSCTLLSSSFDICLFITKQKLALFPLATLWDIMKASLFSFNALLR